MSLWVDLGIADVEDLSQLAGLVDELGSAVDTLAPVADQLVDILFKFSPAAKKLVSAISDYMVDRNIQSFARMCAGGFTRDEAMAILLANQPDYVTVFKNLNK